MTTTTEPRLALGTITCTGCGGPAQVYKQRRGKQRYLYYRCPTCGPEQRNGAAVQSHIYDHTDWVNPELADTHKPPNYIQKNEPAATPPTHELPAPKASPSWTANASLFSTTAVVVGAGVLLKALLSAAKTIA